MLLLLFCKCQHNLIGRGADLRVPLLLCNPVHICTFFTTGRVKGAGILMGGGGGGVGGAGEGKVEGEVEGASIEFSHLSSHWCFFWYFLYI